MRRDQKGGWKDGHSDSSATCRGSGRRAGGPAGGAGSSAGAIAGVGILLVLVGLALGAWRLADPPRRFENLCHSVDSVVDLTPCPAG
jgi:hypothetical protein